MRSGSNCYHSKYWLALFACRLIVLASTLFLTPTALLGQGTKADYERSAGLTTQLTPLLYDTASPPEWIDGGPRFSYQVHRKDGWEFVVVDPKKAEKRPAFDHEKLAMGLAKASGGAIDPKALPFSKIRLDGGKVRFQAFAKPWLYDPVMGSVVPDAKPNADRPPRPKPHPDTLPGQFDSHPISPDGKIEASIDENFNVTFRNRDTDEPGTLTTDGSDRDPYLPEFYWSPDSSKLIVVREAVGEKTKANLIESSPSDGGRPRTLAFELPQPGDKLARRRPVLFDMEDKVQIPIADDLFLEPYDLNSIRWNPDSEYFTFIYNPRGHQYLRAIAVDGDTGKARTLFEERSKTFVDYVYKSYLRHLDASGEILWMSERDGWNHLYVLDAKTGAVKRQLTKGEWLVRRVDRVDTAAKQVWFWAHGVWPEQDPYHLHYCRVNLDGTGLTVLTEGDGSHEVWFSPDRSCFVDTYSRVDLPPVTELRSARDGKLILNLERANASLMQKAGWQFPERFVAKGRDGKTDIYGVIYRPTNFDAKKKYPIVEEIYSGPTEFHVPKRFTAVNDPIQPIVELGFIGVIIDGMGTNWRNKAFHDACWKNLADGGFPDRIAWVQAAAAKHPELDLTRVGIYGGSAGGRNALRALIAHNDFYKVAVADSGNHDDRFHNIWYGELWMGHPIGPQYEEQSNVAQASKMKGKLLLIAGELDRNVDPALTMRTADALIKADKDFDMLIVPGGTHCPTSLPYVSRKRMDFFVRHLLGVEPRAN